MNDTELLRLFADEEPVSVRQIDSSRGDSDFRLTLIAEFESGARLVVKAAANGFTTPERIAMWQRTAQEYRRLGAYCPEILPALDGSFPAVSVRGHACFAHAERYAEYASADTFDEKQITENGSSSFMDDAILLTARVAAKHFDFTALPSGWCMFELFDPMDGEDEVMQNARGWMACAARLPQRLRARADAVIERWLADRAALQAVWHLLPTSVFQADLNRTNCLLDERGRFVGLYDFNLAGREVYLNYLFREVPYITTPSGTDHEVQSILHALRIAKTVYRFSDAERAYAPLLWRVLKPLWFPEAERFRAAGDDPEQQEACIARAEYLQTREIPFADEMN